MILVGEGSGKSLFHLENQDAVKDRIPEPAVSWILSGLLIPECGIVVL